MDRILYESQRQVCFSLSFVLVVKLDQDDTL